MEDSFKTQSPRGKWKSVEWPFDSEYAKTVECWMIKCGRGKIYLENKENFPFVSSFGHDSDRSFSGCFYGHDKIKTLQDAMRELKNRKF